MEKKTSVLFGERLRELRMEAGYSQNDLAKIAKISKSSVNMYERGEREPGFETMEAFADIFNVDMNYLMGQSDKKGRLFGDFSSTSPLPSNAIPYEPTGFAPILGSIPAGYPVMAMECIEGYAPVNRANPEEYFWLRVTGTSMINAGIGNGDLVLIHRQSHAEDKQIVACRVNGDEATLKRFIIQGDTVILMPENPEYSPRVVSIKDFDEGRASIIGVAVTVQREL